MKKIYYLLFNFLLVSSFIYSQEDQKQLYQDLDKEIKTARKAYYKKLKSENDSTRLEIYSIRKEHSKQKFIESKERTVSKQTLNKEEREKIQKDLADSRRSKKIKLSNEVEQIRVNRKDFQEKESEKRLKKQQKITNENEQKLNDRSEKKKRDYNYNKQVYKDKIDKRRELVLARYSTN